MQAVVVERDSVSRVLNAPPSRSESSNRATSGVHTLLGADLQRVFAIDVLTCPYCGAKRKLIALINDGLVVRKILAHLGLPTEPPRLAPARAPPQVEFAFEE